jgi:uncharacterized damage-inducible protein DinB
MNADEIRTLFDYSDWASQRILRATLLVTPEQFNAPNTAGHDSLRGTLFHMLTAQITWRTRLERVAPPAELPCTTPAELKEAWVAEEARLRAYLQTLSDSDLPAPVSYKNSKGLPFEEPLWQILMHLLNHGTQHRAEAAAMLTDFSLSPGDIDMILYFREKAL